MAPAHVLRFPRTDEEGSFVLVHATQVRSKALDMKLIGTDGLAPYATTLRHSQAATLMVKSAPVSPDEWIALLTSLLRQEHVDDLEAVATVEVESFIVITFRKKVRGITQRLGTLELKHSPDEEIELFDWCGLAADVGSRTNDSLISVTAKAAELEETATRLRAQLDELVEAKRADETQLLEKFRDLLNEKKVKIREQQRVLATAATTVKTTGSASLDPGTAGVKSEPPSPSQNQGRKKYQDEAEDEDQGSRNNRDQRPGVRGRGSGSGRTRGRGGRPAGKSRPAKRKGHPVQETDEEEEKSDDHGGGVEADDVDKMDVDDSAKGAGAEEEDNAGAPSDDEQRQTTDAGTETASEDEDEDPYESLGSTKRPIRGAAAAATRKAAPGKAAAAAVKPGRSSNRKGDRKEDGPLPAMRDLPFGRKKAEQQSMKPAPPPAGSETESDDEL